MECPPLTHILFDFFGTLVEYSASRTDQGFRRSHALLQQAGSELEYESFLATWDETFSRLEDSAKASKREFSMRDGGRQFLPRALDLRDRPVDDGFLDAFIALYIEEWNQGVRYLPGLREMLGRLAERYSLAIISNTHEADLVPNHLSQMGVADFFSPVVLSVEFGERKPAASIFQHTLRELGVAAEHCLYVGDNIDADYHGARNAGLRALLIDGSGVCEIPAEARLRDILELESHL
jgi:putative hydrolase of the HAD superfamily